MKRKTRPTNVAEPSFKKNSTPFLTDSRKRQLEPHSNDAEPLSKKTKNNEREDSTKLWFYDDDTLPFPLMSRPSLTPQELLAQQKEIDKWFQEISAPPKQSDCNISISSLLDVIRDSPVDDDDIDFDNIFA